MSHGLPAMPPDKHREADPLIEAKHEVEAGMRNHLGQLREGR
ncbi:hypothetical protein ACSSV6_004213 [Roseovarius sp. MBR-38]